MPRTNRARLAVAVLALGLAGTACSAEKMGEAIAENAVERACRDEGTECDVDIDGGAVNLRTADGSMRIDDKGNAVFAGADGQVVSVDGDDNGNMTITDGDGSVVVEQNGDTMTIAGEDGDSTYTTGSEIPAEFPSGIVIPGDASVVASSVIANGGTGNTVMLTVTVPGDLAAVSAAATQGVAGAGYTELVKTESSDGGYYAYEGNGTSVSLTVAPDAGGVVSVSYVVAPT